LSRADNASFIVDANVLIDYADSDLQILSSLSQHIGRVHVARSTFEKVRQLTEAAVKEHNLLIQTPDFATVAAASQVRGSLAYDDRETLLLASKHGWACVTNDKPLRVACEAESIVCLWGLEPMKLLVERRLISGTKALAVARKIQETNPKFITGTIVGRFEQQIKEIVARVGRK
jgi:predicted nucleic acid-binding protein